tara:strand:+ start:2322 stop:3104 length:783 start_codon:yes stop_codon:yes gene_type:complete
MLKFSDANAKLEELYNVPELEIWLADGRKVRSLDLLSGWSCPFAVDCLSKVIELPTGKKAIKDGPETEFRCFSASQEVLFPGVYKRRKHNYDTLRGLHLNDMIHRLNQDKPKNTGILRFHVGGDFFNSDYFFAALNLAMMNPDKLFYAYTKSLKYWVKYREWADKIDNFILTASRGGRDDSLIDSEDLRETVVVFSEAEAEEKGLEIDHDDSHAAVPDWEFDDFALLIHGTQPKGSEASKALQLLRKNKVKHSYNRKAKK